MLQQFSLSTGGVSDTEFNAQARSVLFDDFAYDVNTNTPAGPMGFYAFGGNGGNPSAYTAAPAGSLVNHIGLAPMSTGATNNNTGFAIFIAQNSGTYPGACSSMTYECCVYTPAALSDGTTGYRIELGFRSTQTAGTSTNAMCVVYDQSTSTNWQAYTANNGSVTAVTTADSTMVVNAASFYTIKIVAVAGLVSFYVRAGAGAYSLIGTSATNLPDATHRTYMNCCHYKTGGASAVGTVLTYDWMKLDTTVSR